MEILAGLLFINIIIAGHMINPSTNKDYTDVMPNHVDNFSLTECKNPSF